MVKFTKIDSLLIEYIKQKELKYCLNINERIRFCLNINSIGPSWEPLCEPIVFNMYFFIKSSIGTQVGIGRL